MRRTALAVVAALVTAPAAHAYPWPVKPFGAEHPIRGGFNDPRSLRGSVDPTVDNPLSFHDGVDIQAPDRTGVYAVADGIVSFPSRSAVAVSGGDGTTFGYWHITPVVSATYVRRGDLLGYIRPGFGHVHFAERRFGSYVNPLARGNLEPFRDPTPPVLRALVFYRCKSRTELSPESVDGCVDMAVDAYDAPSMRPAPPWDGAILSPTRITWSGLFPLADLLPPGMTTQSVDLSAFSTGDVRDVYAPGTRQNQPNLPGTYRFVLARGIDTSLLEDGAHTVRVTATDARGNVATRRLSFTVANVPPNRS